LSKNALDKRRQCDDAHCTMLVPEVRDILRTSNSFDFSPSSALSGALIRWRKLGASRLNDVSAAKNSEFVNLNNLIVVSRFEDDPRGAPSSWQQRGDIDTTIPVNDDGSGS
jgi:hypothetical protein